MNDSRNGLTLFLIVSTLAAVAAAGFFAWRASEDSEQVVRLQEALRDSIKLNEDLNQQVDEFDTVEQRMEKTGEMLDELQGLLDANEAARRELASALDQARQEMASLMENAETSEELAEGLEDAVTKTGKKNPMKELMKMSMKMLENPQVRAQMRTGMKAQVEAQYGEWIDSLNLTPETREALLEALTDRMVSQLDTFSLMLDEDATDQEVMDKQNELFEASDMAMNQLLQPAHVDELNRWESSMDQRQAEQKVNGQIETLGLTGPNAESVRQILLEERELARQEEKRGDSVDLSGGMDRGIRRMDLPEIEAARSFFNDDDYDFQETISKRREQNDRAAQRVEPYMTPEQHESFVQQQEQEIEMIEMSMQMFGGAED